MKKLMAMLVVAVLVFSCTAMAADTFAFTADKMQTEKWDPNWASCRVQLDDGSLQIGTGSGAGYTLSGWDDAEAMFNKTVEFEAKIDVKDAVSFHFRHDETAAGIGASATYTFNVWAGGSVEVLRWNPDGSQVLLSNGGVAVDGFDPTVFNNYKVTVLNEDNGTVSITVVINDVEALKVVDENPTAAHLEPGVFMLQGGYNVTVLRAVAGDASAEETAPATAPATPSVPTGDTYKLTGERLADTTIWNADWASAYLQGYDASTKELTMQGADGGTVTVLNDTESIHNKIVEFEAKVGSSDSFSLQLRSKLPTIVNNDGNSDYGFFISGGKAYIRKWVDGAIGYQWEADTDFSFDKRTFYNVKLAAIDQDDGSVKLSMWIDDELIVEGVDSDNPFTDPGYLVFWCQGRVVLRDFGELPAETAPATTPAETVPATVPAETAPATTPAATTPTTGGISLIAVAGLGLVAASLASKKRK